MSNFVTFGDINQIFLVNKNIETLFDMFTTQYAHNNIFF